MHEINRQIGTSKSVKTMTVKNEKIILDLIKKKWLEISLWEFDEKYFFYKYWLQFFEENNFFFAVKYSSFVPVCSQRIVVNICKISFIPQILVVLPSLILSNWIYNNFIVLIVVLLVLYLECSG